MIYVLECEGLMKYTDYYMQVCICVVRQIRMTVIKVAFLWHYAAINSETRSEPWTAV